MSESNGSIERRTPGGNIPFETLVPLRYGAFARDALALEEDADVAVFVGVGFGVRDINAAGESGRE